VSGGGEGLLLFCRVFCVSLTVGGGVGGVGGGGRGGGGRGGVGMGGEGGGEGERVEGKGSKRERRG